MELNKLKTGTKAIKGSNQGNIKRYYNLIKDFVVPPTHDKKKERYSQYKDFAMFLVSIIVIAKFEDKIKAYLQIQTDDLKKLSVQGLM